MGELPFEPCWSFKVLTIFYILSLCHINVLIMIVNYRQCHNFQSDINDSEIYTYLMKQIAPIDSDVDMSALMVIIKKYLLNT